MNLKLILFVISIIQLSVSLRTPECAYKNESNLDPFVRVDCAVDYEKDFFRPNTCDKLKEVINISSVPTVLFINCKISDFSDISNEFPNISKLAFVINNILPSTNFSIFPHLSAFKSYDSLISTYITSATPFSMNAADLKTFIFKSNTNNMVSISLENASKLEIFAIQETMVSNLPADLFENSNNLKIVHADKNKIENIDAMRWPNSVVWIDLTSNKISQLTKDSMKNLRNLQFLELSENEIIKVEAETFSQLNNLLYLELNKNHIQEISKNMLQGLNNLVYADFWKNNINYIEDGAFESTPNLLALHLGINKISSLNQQTLAGLNRLIFLNLNEASIRELNTETFGNLSELRILEMESGMLEKVDFNAFANLPKLGRLNLRHNNISHLVKMAPTTWNFSENENITFRSDLMKIADDINLEWAMPLVNNGGQFLRQEKMQFLMGQQNISDYKEFMVDYFMGMFPELENGTNFGLKMLDLAENELTEIERNVFAEFKTLNQLDLSSNPITKLYPESFAGLNNLISLDLCFCKLTSVDFSIFAPLTHLEELNLSFNKLQSIIAAPIPSVKVFSLYKNSLVDFPMKKIDFPNLETFYIGNDQFNCSNVDPAFAQVNFYCH